ncbi:hypothetical protein FS837_010951 [Tulasnella sp. UAMH 9824]|nr:hypothetical protein FS837_010951 [Tulasnella sp. UAMH 9824]
MSNSRNLSPADTDDAPAQAMEISQPEPAHGDKSNQLVNPTDSNAVDPPLAPPAGANEPLSNIQPLPTLKVDHIEAQDAVSSDQGASQGTQSTQPTSTDAQTAADSLATPDSEVNSVIQPGRQVSDSQLPTELSGALTKLQELPGSVKKKEAKIDDGTYADVFQGTLERPDGSKIDVAIKCIRRIDGATDDRFNTLCGAARGLAHLHSLTPVIVHGDIKPDNVLVKDNLEAALCDFGVSRIFVGTGKTSGLTTTGNRIGGTAGYQAKEVLIHTHPTAAGDVYAFGGLILAAMSGSNPFWKKKNEAVRIAAVCMDEIPLPKDHPRLPASDPLWGLLRECWSSEPEQRPKMEGVLQRLESERETRLARESSS